MLSVFTIFSYSTEGRLIENQTETKLSQFSIFFAKTYDYISKIRIWEIISAQHEEILVLLEETGIPRILDTLTLEVITCNKAKSVF